MPQKAKENTDKAKEYTCFHCGKSYTIQKGNFPKVRSPLYVNNNGYLPWCKNCVVEQYNEYEQKYGVDEALRRACMKYDLYFSPLVVRAAQPANGNATNSKILAYISKSHLNQVTGVCYDDTSLEDENSVSGIPKEEMNARREAGISDVSAASIERWGIGFAVEEYKALDSHYKMLTKQIENIDFVQETLIRDLCAIKVQQGRAIAAKEIDKFEKLTKLYQLTLANAKLKVSDGQTNSDSDTFGVWLSQIEKNCPADFYDQPDMYKDYFGIDGYCDRHMFRPLKNLLLNEKVQDEEFNIGEDE